MKSRDHSHSLEKICGQISELERIQSLAHGDTWTLSWRIDRLKQERDFLRSLRGNRGSFLQQN